MTEPTTGPTTGPISEPTTEPTTGQTTGRRDRAGSTAPTDAGRPRTARMPREERRAQLVAAAREVFVQKGYHNASVDDIADRAGVSKPVVYQHFPGKLELYLALLDESTTAMVDAVQAALQSTTDNSERVAATMAAYFAFVGDETRGYRLVFESDLVHDAAVRERVARAEHECASLVCDVIAEDTGLPEVEAMLLAVALIGMAQVSARWALTTAEVDSGAAADLVGELAWRGLSRFPLGTEGADSAPSANDGPPSATGT